MATIVERPRSALSESPVTLQPRRRPSIVEVIDVDQLDESSTNNHPRPISYRPSRRQFEAIFVIDSDEEDGYPVRSGSPRPVHRRQRLSSPPPPVAGPSRIPPVPPIPPRYSSFASFTPPHPAPSPPVVRPIAEPFAFEVNLRLSPPAAPSALHTHPNRHRRISYAETQPSPRSHHVPSLGLGGALISLNRSRPDDRQHGTRYEHQRQAIHDGSNAASAGPSGLLTRAGNTVRRLYAAFGRGSNNAFNEQDLPEMQMMLARDLGLDIVGVDPLHHPALQEVLAQNSQRIRQRQQDAMYNAAYTHPVPPEQGFTYDFAISEPLSSAPPKSAPIVIDIDDIDDIELENSKVSVAGPSSDATTMRSPTSTFQTLLVCARCLDPLILGGGLVGEERLKRKIWALRCGHMIDGKCLDVIGIPDTGPYAAKVTDGSPSKGKGKAKAYDEAEASSPSLDNSIRSRLRSRVPPPVMPITPSPSMPSGFVAPTLDLPKPTTLGKRKRSSNAKRRIEATHEWNCPVSGCGRVHVSVKINGTWVPESSTNTGNGKGKGKSESRGETTLERGAVAVFV